MLTVRRTSFFHADFLSFLSFFLFLSSLHHQTSHSRRGIVLSGGHGSIHSIYLYILTLEPATDSLHTLVLKTFLLQKLLSVIMTKRKRLLFGRLAGATKSSHEPAVDHKCHSGKTDSALTSWNDLPKEDSPSCAGLSSKIRRGSARLLFKLGLRTSVHTKSSAQSEW